MGEWRTAFGRIDSGAEECLEASCLPCETLVCNQCPPEHRSSLTSCSVHLKPPWKLGGCSSLEFRCDANLHSLVSDVSGQRPWGRRCSPGNRSYSQWVRVLGEASRKFTNMEGSIRLTFMKGRKKTVCVRFDKDLSTKNPCEIFLRTQVPGADCDSCERRANMEFLFLHWFSTYFS